MSKNEFDELLLKKLREEELEYDPAHWDRLAQLLPPTLAPASGNKGKKWAIAAGIAAAVAFILATVFFIMLMDQSVVEPSQKTVVHQPAQPGNNIVTLPENNTTTVQQTQQPVIAKQGNNVAVIANKNNNAQASQANHTNGNNILTPSPAFLQHNQQEVVSNQIQPAAPANDPVLKQENVTRDYNALVREEKQKAASLALNNTSNDIMPIRVGGSDDKTKSKTSVSLGGGVNYGNLNTGYTAGVSIRRKVIGDFFVDGSVAMLYNNNANNVAVNNGPSLGETAARPAAFNQTPLASPALDPIQKLYYVQFNPSIGYQIEKYVALSVGGDFQKMLNSKEEIVQPESNNAKVFPNFDVGLTTKSEFSITPSIQAGLLYREGLNNLIKNDGSKYVNRRYIQVQFKYNIPIN